MFWIRVPLTASYSPLLACANEEVAAAQGHTIIVIKVGGDEGGPDERPTGSVILAHRVVAYGIIGLRPRVLVEQVSAVCRELKAPEPKIVLPPAEKRWR